MCLSTTHYKLPTAESPAGNCSLARIFLERQRDIALLRDVDERLPGDEVQRPGIFLIAHECNHDPRSIQSAHALQRLERVEHYDIATLHVRAASAGRERIHPDKSFALALEDSIEVPDQQQPLAMRAFSHREQVSGAADGVRQRNPLRVESDR